jgi:hypothetical protein
MLPILLFFGLMLMAFSMTETEASTIRKYDLKQRCGIYFKTEAGFVPSDADSDVNCEYAGGFSASYIFSTRDIYAKLDETEGDGFVSFWKGDSRLTYTMYGRYFSAGWNEKILRREFVNSLKKTKRDKIVVSLIRGEEPFNFSNKPPKYYWYICWDALLYDAKSDGGAVLNLCNEYQKGTPLVSLNSWQARLIKSFSFHFIPGAFPSFDCARPHTGLEHTFCSDKDLAALDVTLAENYDKARRATKGEKHRQLLDTQRAWLKQRNACGTAQCLTDAYTRRIKELCEQHPESACPAAGQ